MMRCHADLRHRRCHPAVFAAADLRAANPAVLARAHQDRRRHRRRSRSRSFFLRASSRSPFRSAFSAPGCSAGCRHGYVRQSRRVFGGGKRRRTDVARALAFLEMELDHDTGAMRGRIVAGPHAGPSLDEFDLADTGGDAADFDEESRALLDGYLDRRFPAWREHAQGDAAGGRAARRSGKMTERRPIRSLACSRGRAATKSGVRIAR